MLIVCAKHTLRYNDEEGACPECERAPTFSLYTPNSESLALQCAAYRAAGAPGQDERGKLETVPRSLLKPISGPCILCRHVTEDKHDGDWIHDGCNDELIAGQRADYKLDGRR